jgi:hypothetical protein
MSIYTQLANKPYSQLLTLIKSVESVNDSYSSVVGYTKSPKPAGDLTKLTIQEIVDTEFTQPDKKNGGTKRSKFIGAYQLDQDELLNWSSSAGLSPSDKFDATNQDTIAVWLIETRQSNIGQKFRLGSIGTSPSLQDVSEMICRIWAGVPILFSIKRGKNGGTPKKNLIKGMSYYAGVGDNKANASKADEFQSILANINPTAPQPSSSDGILPVSASTLRELTDEDIIESSLTLGSPFSSSSIIPESEYLNYTQR